MNGHLIFKLRPCAAATWDTFTVEFEFDLVRPGFLGRERDGVRVQSVSLCRRRHLTAVHRHLQIARASLARLNCSSNNSFNSKPQTILIKH